MNGSPQHDCKNDIITLKFIIHVSITPQHCDTVIDNLEQNFNALIPHVTLKRTITFTYGKNYRETPSKYNAMKKSMSAW